MNSKTYILIALSLLLLFPFAGYGQQEQDEEVLEYNLTSPYYTIFTHLNYLEDDNYFPFVAAKSINPEIFSEEEAIEIVAKLKQIYIGEGLHIEFDEIPRDRDYLDTLLYASPLHRYIILPRFPEIYLEKEGERWFYSKHTCEQVAEIHSRIYPFGTANLLKILPRLGERQILGIYLWQHITILLLILFSFFIYKLFTLIFEKLIIGVMTNFRYREKARKYILPVARPFSLLMVIWFLVNFVPLIQLPTTSGKYVVLILKAGWPVFGTVFFYRFVDILALYFARLASKTETSLDDQIVPLVRKALKVFVAIVGSLYILNNLNVDIVPLLAGLSIGGLAFALAAQDTIKNFFGSIMIFVDKPFQTGDWITSGDIDGTVEEVGFRSTRIRTFRNSVTSVPNGKMADLTIDNHGLRIYRRFSTSIAITYDTPADLIQLFVDGLKKIVEAHPQTRKDFYQIHLNSFADSSLNIMFYIFFTVPTWDEELLCRHEVMLEIIKLSEKLGVRFAFPTQTLHVETFPGKKSLTPEYTESTPQLKAKMEAYLKKLVKQNDK